MANVVIPAEIYESYERGPNDSQDMTVDVGNSCSGGNAVEVAFEILYQLSYMRAEIDGSGGEMPFTVDSLEVKLQFVEGPHPEEGNHYDCRFCELDEAYTRVPLTDTQDLLREYLSNERLKEFTGRYGAYIYEGVQENISPEKVTGERKQVEEPSQEYLEELVSR